MAFTEGHAVWTYVVIVLFNVSLYVYKPREYKYLFFCIHQYSLDEDTTPVSSCCPASS